MNRNTSLVQASTFGPPSEPVNIGEFLESAKNWITPASADATLFAPDKTAIAGWDKYAQLSDEERAAIEVDCSIDSLKTTLEAPLNDVRLAVHTQRWTRAVVGAVFDAADESARRAPKKTAMPDPEEEHADVAALQNALDAIRLKSWQLSLRSAAFMRTSAELYDANALSEVKLLRPDNEIGEEPECLISFSHAVLSSQTLRDAFDSIPCGFNKMPEEVLNDDEKVINYEKPTGSTNPGCVICIEGIAYGDGQNEEDYSGKLLQAIENLPETRKTQMARGPCMDDTPLSSLTLRLHKPYWLLHAGNCIHYLVFDEIRLLHPTDPRHGYPLTLHTQPVSIPTCRGCSRVPGRWAVNGDVRLGESPCVLCAPCWRNMGMPKDVQEGEVIAVPLPTHELAR